MRYLKLIILFFGYALVPGAHAQVCCPANCVQDGNHCVTTGPNPKLRTRGLLRRFAEPVVRFTRQRQRPGTRSALSTVRIDESNAGATQRRDQ
jgi:hypothetical protein